MSERLKGQFCGCPYHDDDYEACIQYSGQAPCDPPDGWRLVPVEPTREMVGDSRWARSMVYKQMLAAAPRPGGGDD